MYLLLEQVYTQQCTEPQHEFRARVTIGIGLPWSAASAFCRSLLQPSFSHRGASAIFVWLASLIRLHNSVDSIFRESILGDPGTTLDHFGVVGVSVSEAAEIACTLRSIYFWLAATIPSSKGVGGVPPTCRGFRYLYQASQMHRDCQAQRRDYLHDNCQHSREPLPASCTRSPRITGT